MAAHSQWSRERNLPAGRSAAGRLRLLASLENDLAETDVLLAVLQHAVAELGGLGGMVHLRGPGPDARIGLRLIVSSGVPRAFAQAWLEVRGDQAVAPALAVRENAFVWLPGLESDGRHVFGGVTPGQEVPPSLPEATGMAAVPLLGPNGPLGTLTVLTMAPGRPNPGHRAFLEAVGEWTAWRLQSAAAITAETAATWVQPQPTGPSPQQALNAVRMGTYDWDIRTGQLSYSDTTLDLFGITPESFDGRIESWTAVVHPDDLPRVVAESDRIVRTRGAGESEYRVCRPDGTQRWVQSRGQVVVGEDGEPRHVIGTVWDTTETHAAMESVGRALRHMSDGFLAVGGDWRIMFVNVEAERLIGSSQEVAGRPLWDVPAVREVPGLEARCRRAATDGTPASLDIRWPQNDRWYHLRLVPVPNGLTFYFTDFTDKRQRAAELAAAQHAAAERAARIGELTLALAQAVTSQDVVTAVAERVLPPFGATGLLVLTLEIDRMHVVGSVGYPPEFLEKVHGTPLHRLPPVADALRTGTPRFSSSPEEIFTRYPLLTDLVDTVPQEAWALLPLIASGRPVGVCVISFDRPRRLSEEERTLLTALNGLVAQALERARLYDAEHTRARALQRGLLPRELPTLPAVDATARYLAAGQGLDVGGDWYDVIPLSGDRVALVIGDVMGHGLSEAATMGRLRTAVRTLSDLELPPDEILGRLNDIVSDLGDDFYATFLYAVYDPTTRICSFALAGHPPPAVVRPDGTVSFPALTPNPPLGAAEPPFDTVELEIPEGSLLVLYTDGLIESKIRDIDRGMEHLAQTLTSVQRVGGTGDLDRLCDTLSRTLLPAHQQSSDDAALLIARTRWLTPDNVASWSLPDAPQAAGQAREHISEQLATWHLDELVTTTELLASELVSNVIRHAKGPMKLRLLRSRTLICEVSDGSLTTPHIRRASDTDEGGRGLQLVAALSQRWGTRFTADGKCIWTEQALT